jgi:hypothetical protein
MSNKPVQPDPEETHADLLATLAAGRELGPEMDKALAESYIQRHPELAGKQQQAVVAQPAPQRAITPDVVGLAGMGIGVVAYLAVLAASGGHLWWMFWPIMAWSGWRWGWWGHHGGRDQMRQARYEARAERYRARAARWGYYNGQGYPQAPEPQPQQPLPQQSEAQVSAPAPVRAPIPGYPLPPPPPPVPAPASVTPTAQQSQPLLETRPSDVPPLNPAG